MLALRVRVVDIRIDEADVSAVWERRARAAGADHGHAVRVVQCGRVLGVCVLGAHSVHAVPAGDAAETMVDKDGCVREPAAGVVEMAGLQPDVGVLFDRHAEPIQLPASGDLLCLRLLQSSQTAQVGRRAAVSPAVGSGAVLGLRVLPLLSALCDFVPRARRMVQEPGVQFAYIVLFTVLVHPGEALERRLLKILDCE